MNKEKTLSKNKTLPELQNRRIAVLILKLSVIGCIVIVTMISLVYILTVITEYRVSGCFKNRKSIEKYWREIR